MTSLSTRRSTRSDRRLAVVGETQFGQDQYLVMAVTVHRPGLVRTRGVHLTYANGWQHGTQTIGTTLRVVSR